MYSKSLVSDNFQEYPFSVLFHGCSVSSLEPLKGPLRCAAIGQ